MTFPQYDTDLLIAINAWNTPFLDNWMWNISETLTWLPLFITLIICLVYRFGKRSILYILALAACVGLADFIASGIIKEWVMRPRPTRDPNLQGILHIVNGYKGGLYGFVSSHAANTVSICILYSFLWREWRVTFSLIIFALLNCYSRMYLGVHYPLDIVGGIGVGIFTSLLVYYIIRRISVLLDSKSLILEKVTTKKEETLSINVSSIIILSVTLLSLLTFCFLNL